MGMKNLVRFWGKGSIGPSHPSSVDESTRCCMRLRMSPDMQTELVPRLEQLPKGLGAAGAQPGAPTAGSKRHCVHMEGRSRMGDAQRAALPTASLGPLAGGGSSLPRTFLGAESCLTPGQGLAAPTCHQLRLLQRPEELGDRSDFSLFTFLCTFMLME